MLDKPYANALEASSFVGRIVPDEQRHIISRYANRAWPMRRHIRGSPHLVIDGYW